MKGILYRRSHAVCDRGHMWRDVSYWEPNQVDGWSQGWRIAVLRIRQDSFEPMLDFRTGAR
jgi:hypothetical protein